MKTRSDGVMECRSIGLIRTTAPPQYSNTPMLLRQLRFLGFTLCAMLFALCSPAEAQQPVRTPRIGYLSPVDATRESARSEAIRQALRELGYIEGHNIAIEYRYAEGKANRYAELAAELVRLKVDIIVVVGGGRLILAAKNATKTIPIVMGVAVIDPVEAGVISKHAFFSLK